MPCLGRVRSVLAEPTPTDGAVALWSSGAAILLAAIALLTG
jgi:hypothetical protein